MCRTLLVARKFMKWASKTLLKPLSVSKNGIVNAPLMPATIILAEGYLDVRSAEGRHM